MSSPFETWVGNLRLPWMRTAGKAIMGALANVVGDRAIDWATQALLEHLPEYASAAAVALIASERQIDVGPTETASALGSRLVYSVQAWQRAGSPLGMLLALYYAGFPGAVLVQTNGNAYSLTLPLPAVGNDPPANLVLTTLGLNPFIAAGVLPALPTATVPWWTFDATDLDAATPPNQFTSRFAVLFPGGTFPPSFTTYATATFDGTQDSVAVAWNNAFPDTTYKILVGPPTVTDGAGGVLVDADGSTKSKTGVTIRTSARFSGTVDVLAYQAGSNPFADPHAPDLARLRAVIAKWKPAKAKCMGIFVAAQGKFFGWPVRTFGSGGTFGSSTIVSFSA